MNENDIFMQLQHIGEDLIEQTGQEIIYPKRKKIRLSTWGTIAVSVMLAVLICIAVILKQNPVVQQWENTYSGPPIYNLDKIDNLLQIDITDIQDTHAQSMPTYTPDNHCLDANTSEQPPEAITEPYIYDIQYNNGKFYACIVSGYSPTYKVSECGGWHYDDAIVKTWYEINMEDGSLSKQTDIQKSNPSSFIFGTDGHYQTVWTNQPNIKDGYTSYTKNGNLYLLYNQEQIYTAPGKYTVSSVAIVGDEYVVCQTDKDYHIIHIQNKEQILSFPFTNKMVLFLYKDFLYYDTFDNFNGTHSMMRINLQTKEEELLLSPAPIRNVKDLYIQKNFVILNIMEGFTSEGQGGLYYINLEQPFKLNEIPLPPQQENLPLIDYAIGPIYESKIYYTASYADTDMKNTTNYLYCYNIQTGDIIEIVNTDSYLSKILYAGNLYCTYTKSKLICGKLN